MSHTGLPQRWTQSETLTGRASQTRCKPTTSRIWPKSLKSMKECKEQTEETGLGLLACFIIFMNSMEGRQEKPEYTACSYLI